MNCCMRKKDFSSGEFICTGYRVPHCPNDKSCKFYKPDGCIDWVRIGDIFKIKSNKQAKELWKRLEQEARDRKNAEKKAQAKADITRRQAKTPSRKYVGKHDVKAG